MTGANKPFLTIQVPGHPIGKARPRILRSGRSYTPGPTKAWEEAAAVIARAALEQLGGKATLTQLYREIEGARPTTNRFWREKVRQQVQAIGYRVAGGCWALAN